MVWRAATIAHREVEFLRPFGFEPARDTMTAARIVGVLDVDGRASPVFAPAPGIIPGDLVGAWLSFSALSVDGSTLSVAAASQVRIRH